MLRGNKPRIRFGNIMLGSEFLSNHFSPLLEWNITLLYNRVVLYNSLPIKKNYCTNSVLDKLIFLPHFGMVLLAGIHYLWAHDG